MLRCTYRVLYGLIFVLRYFDLLLGLVSLMNYLFVYLGLDFFCIVVITSVQGVCRNDSIVGWFTANARPLPERDALLLEVSVAMAVW